MTRTGFDLKHKYLPFKGKVDFSKMVLDFTGNRFSHIGKAESNQDRESLGHKLSTNRPS